MRVLFVTRSTIFSIPGGDTIQMQNTAKNLLKFGYKVDIFDGEFIDYSQYDFLHFFNITRPAIILDQIKKSGLPYVLSPIYVEYDFYSKLEGISLMKTLTKIFGVNGIEYLKILIKHLLRKERVEYLRYFLMGQKKSILRILSGAEVVLPNSESEYHRLFKNYKCNTPYHVVSNGVDLNKFKNQNKFIRKEKSVLCAALIEPRKNQLNLIKALNNTEYSLTIIGSPAPNHLDYLATCKSLAAQNVTIIDKRVSQEDLINYYESNEIHVLPSWFETTGLSSLEAAYMGCKIVVTKCGDTVDYFKENALYCNPGEVNSIRLAIEKSHHSPYSDSLKKEIIEKFNWIQAAQETAKAYKNYFEK